MRVLAFRIRRIVTEKSRLLVVEPSSGQCCVGGKSGLVTGEAFVILSAVLRLERGECICCTPSERCSWDNLEVPEDRPCGDDIA